MILFVNDPDLTELLVEAEREDMADECLAPPGEPFVPRHLDDVARRVFALAGVEIPDNAIFRPRLWRRSDRPGCAAITTTPGETPGREQP